MLRSCYTYIMTNRSGTLYVGMTNDLVRRVWEHKQCLVPGFTSRYRMDRLAHYETFGRPYDAIAREKEIKGWLRIKKIALIEATNRKWLDLSKGWYDVGEATTAGRRAVPPGHAERSEASLPAARTEGPSRAGGPPREGRVPGRRAGRDSSLRSE